MKRPRLHGWHAVLKVRRLSYSGAARVSQPQTDASRYLERILRIPSQRQFVEDKDIAVVRGAPPEAEGAMCGNQCNKHAAPVSFAHHTRPCFPMIDKWKKNDDDDDADQPRG